MSFPRYEAYKESGVPWIGEVPANWTYAHLRRLAQIFSGGTPDKANRDYWDEGTIPWLNSGSVNQALIAEPSAYITEAGLLGSSAKWVPSGSVVMALAGQGKTKGMVAQTAISATCNQSMAAIVAQKEIQPRFLFWWLFSNYENVRNLAGGDLRDGLNLDLLGGIPCPIPSIREQSAIAFFLDRETAKIDALVEEQQQLIALLKEKRQAVISHAVTKGLDPNVSMKHSGVEWLGEVPRHWMIIALKHLVSNPIMDGPHETPQKFDEGIPFISAEALSQGYINFEKKWGYISPDSHEQYSKRYKPRREDILMVKLGATAGAVAIVETDKEFNTWVPLAGIRLKSTVNPYFMLNVLRSTGLKIAYELSWTYGTQQTLGLRTISNLRIPIPPYEEQQEIVSHLVSAAPLFESLAAEAQQAIALLQERRSALISAAVTGKIDVRGLAPSQAEAA